MNPASRLYAWVLVGLLWGVALLNYLDRQVIFSVFPLLRRELSLTDLQLGLVGTTFLWVYGCASPLAGALADRYGRKRVIIASLLIWSAVTFATGMVRSGPELLAARALMGLSEACYLPAGLALIAAYHPERTRSRATGLHFSGIYAGSVLGGTGGGWIGEHYGWRVGFLLLGCIGVGYAMLLAPLLHDRASSEVQTVKAAHPSVWTATRTLLAIPAFLILLFTFGAKSIADWLIATWMPTYLYERFHMSLAQSGFAATFYLQAASLIGVLFGGWLADRQSQSSPRGRTRTQALGFLLAAPWLGLAGLATSPWPLLSGLMAFGLSRGMFDCNAMPVLCQYAPPAIRATGFGLLNFVGTLAGGLAAAMAGALKQTVGLDTLLQAAGILLLVSGVLLWRVPVAQHAE